VRGWREKGSRGASRIGTYEWRENGGRPRTDRQTLVPAQSLVVAGTVGGYVFHDSFGMFRVPAQPNPMLTDC
jgi:hypothetical protein